MIRAMLLAVMVAGQTPSTPAPPVFGCTAPEYRQFDFWVGEWDVFTPAGARAGGNSIRRDYEGCVIVERWNGVRGLNGSSFSMYSPVTRAWHQTWVDNSGMLLLLDGEFRDGAMRLQGMGTSTKGRQLNRVTWTPRADGSVRQFWETSADEGKTWQVAFDGSYRKKAKQESANEIKAHASLVERYDRAPHEWNVGNSKPGETSPRRPRPGRSDSAIISITPGSNRQLSLSDRPPAL